VTMHSKLERFVSKLSPDELEELKLILNQGKGN
jgi:hypothetical protein